MIAPQRRKHLLVWIVLSLALPALIVAALVARPMTSAAPAAREAPP